MLKIEVNTAHNQIGVQTEVKGTRFDITAEIYTMLKSFEVNYPNELARAVTILCIEHQEENDG